MPITTADRYRWLKIDGEHYKIPRDLIMDQKKQYAERGMEVLREPEYIAHVQAMTAEALHSKADIAAELAFRDIRIRVLEQGISTPISDHIILLLEEIRRRLPPLGWVSLTNGVCGMCGTQWTGRDRCPQCYKEVWACRAHRTADPPQDCDAPFCGCNPAWVQCMEWLIEAGWGPEEPSEQAQG